MLAAEQLAFGFPGRTVGAGVSFSLEAGEVLCLLGPNGGGKTTLLRTLLGLLPPREGIVRLAGRPMRDHARDEVARLVGYVPQAHAGAFAYSVLDMVLMGRNAHLKPFATPGRADREAAEGALALLGIAALADRPFTQISGGERQLALIARALAQQPRVLVMDEPASSLDFGNQVRVLSQVRRLASQGMAVLMSSHQPDHALQCADRALLLREGRVLALGPSRDVVTSSTLRRLYGIEVDIVDAGGGRQTCLPSYALR